MNEEFGDDILFFSLFLYVSNYMNFHWQRFYLVGRDKSRARWRVLKIDRSEPSMLSIYEDPAIYTQQDCDDLLRRLAEGNRSCGGLNFVTKAYGIVGKFILSFYFNILQWNLACHSRDAVLSFLEKSEGILLSPTGFIRFLDPYYMILITKRRLIGNIHGHAIYGVGESLLLTVPHPSVLTNLSRIKAENR